MTDMNDGMSKALEALADEATKFLQSLDPTVVKAHVAVVLLPMVQAPEQEAMMPHPTAALVAMNTFANQPTGLMAAAMTLAQASAHHQEQEAGNVH